MKCSNRYLVAMCASCIGLLSAAGTCPADVITTDPGLPPLTGAYMTPDQVHAEYTANGLDIILSQIKHKPIAGTVVRTVNGPDEIENFDSTVDGQVSVNGNPLGPIQLQGPVRVEVFGKVGNVTGTFQTEMLSMDLTGSSPSGPVMIRESPTQASTGQTTITDIGGGEYRISSFFDVFTELSIDGGQSWIPSQGPTHVDLNPCVPEPVGLVALLGLGGMGLVGLVWRRRRT
jgi:hypothetical protein